MKTWKIWLYTNRVSFAVEFRGEYGDVCQQAVRLAHQLNAHFDFDIEEVK